MFRWPQNGGSRGKESFQLSGEEVFLYTTAVKIWRSESAFKWVLTTDRRFKSAFRTKRNKNGNEHYYFAVEFNFWKSVKPQLLIWLQKQLAGTQAFTLAWEWFEHVVVQQSTSAKFWTIFCFQIGFFASAWMKIYC